MSTVVSLPEKRSHLDLGAIPEQPPEKRPKFYGPEMEVQGNKNPEEPKSGHYVIFPDESSDDEDIIYCDVCDVIGHLCWDCPLRSKRMGFGCNFCYGPCKKKDDDTREHRSVEMVKQCVLCGMMGDHWADECPSLIKRPSRNDGEFVPF